MRLLFVGSGEFGIPTLAYFQSAAKHELVAVVTQPDRPAGRKRRLTPTPVAQWAVEHRLDILKTENVNSAEFVGKINDFGPDASIVIAFGQKLGEPLIAAMGKLAVNLHASLLPRYRGAAPINWAMIRGETSTGVSVIALAQRMDAGEVYATSALDIDPDETAGQLHDRLAQLGPDAIARVFADLENNTLGPRPQDEALATQAPKLSKASGTVDFGQPADVVRNRIHGLTPWPGCTVDWYRAGSPQPQRLILRRAAVLPEQDEISAPGTILQSGRVATADGLILLLELQLPGGKPLAIDEFERGHALAPRDRLAAMSSESL